MNNRYPTTALIKKYLEKYIPTSKANRRGLFLLPLQTGSGKTHATIQYMQNHILSNEKFPIIYVVNTIENVKDTYEKLIATLCEEDKQKVLFLQNNADSIIEIFRSNDNKIDNFKYLLKYKEFDILKQHIKIFLKYKEADIRNSYKNIIDGANKNLRTKILAVYKQKSQTTDMSELTKEVSILYPTINLHEYSAIFMTTSKLFYPMFSLEGYYRIFNDVKFKGSLLFMDEFDTQKNAFLNLIIDNEVKNSHDILDLFTRVMQTFNNRKFIKKYNIKQETFSQVVAYFKDVHQKYNMEYGFSYDFREELKDASILVDSTLSSVIEGNNYSAKIDTSKSTQSHVNYISKDGELSFAAMIKDMSRALRMFIGMLRHVLRIELKDIKEEQKSSLIDYGTEYEILEIIAYDLIKELGYGEQDAHYKYLKNVIIQNVFEKRRYFKSGQDELYEDGFKMINISQHDTYSKTNNFEFFELNNSPEKFIKNLANHLFVVGISATATIPTLMRNFDLKYLSSNTNYISLEEGDINMMDKLYIQAKKQENRDIHIEYIVPEKTVISHITEYFDSAFNMNDVLEQHIKTNEYNYLRLIRIVHVYRKFLLHDEIESFMCLMSALPKSDKRVLNPLNIVMLIFEMMKSNFQKFNTNIQNHITELIKQQKELKKDFYQYLVDENILFYIYKAKLENKKDYQEWMEKKDFSKNDKAFIISAYQTMGVGANMEYIPIKNGQTKDYDGIFVDTPTSFTERIFDGENIKIKRVKAMFQLESLYNQGYFSFQEYKKNARSILIKQKSEMKYLTFTDSYNSVMSTIIQAVGRLYRTEFDNSKMFIYLNPEIAKSVKNFDASKQTLLPAIKQLIKYTNTLDVNLNNNEEDLMQCLNRFNISNNKLKQKINFMLKIINSKDIDVDVVHEWEELRMFLIQNPTVPNEVHEYNLYFEKMPSKYKDNRFYYYAQNDDYGEVDISFHDASGRITLSRETAMLDVIANTLELEECVRINKICLDFKYQYMMTPIAFNNLYKGAMGETIGRFLVEKYCEINLVSFDINSGDEYERFDYKLEDNSVYFDFKYYSQSTLETQKQKTLVDNANKKLSDMEANKAVIINIFAEISESTSKKIIIKNNIMIVPFLIDMFTRERPILDIQKFSQIKEFIYDK